MSPQELKYLRTDFGAPRNSEESKIARIEEQRDIEHQKNRRKSNQKDWTISLKRKVPLWTTMSPIETPVEPTRSVLDPTTPRASYFEGHSQGVTIPQQLEDALQNIVTDQASSGAVRDAARIGTRLTMSSRSAYFTDRIITPAMVQLLRQLPESILTKHIDESFCNLVYRVYQLPRF